MADLAGNAPEIISVPDAGERSDVATQDRRPSAVGSSAFGPGMTWLLAWRNLAQDRIRFIVTVVGISFSVVLMGVQGGLLVGAARTASGLVDHAGADFWVASRGVSNVDQTVPLPERWLFKALEAPGVAAIGRLITRFAEWRRPDGRSEIVIVVGFDLDKAFGAPWNIVAGSLEDLRRPDAIMIDRLYAGKLGVTALGQVVEIHGVRAQIVGFTEGIRAFTQSPYVFTSLKNARRYSGLDNDQASYLMVRAAPGADKDELAQQLREMLPAGDILASADFSAITARYWLLTTGAGAALLAGALLGIIVGIIVTAQTLYAATVERLPEYATLAAIGAPSSYLNRIVLKQALISGVFGYCLGIIVVGAFVGAASESSFAMVLPWSLTGAVFVATLAMCGLASLVAVHKIKTIDPTMVFR